MFFESMPRELTPQMDHFLFLFISHVSLGQSPSKSVKKKKLALDETSVTFKDGRSSQLLPVTVRLPIGARVPCDSPSPQPLTKLRPKPSVPFFPFLLMRKRCPVLIKLPLISSAAAGITVSSSICSASSSVHFKVCSLQR